MLSNKEQLLWNLKVKFYHCCTEIMCFKFCRTWKWLKQRSFVERQLSIQQRSWRKNLRQKILIQFTGNSLCYDLKLNDSKSLNNLSFMLFVSCKILSENHYVNCQYPGYGILYITETKLENFNPVSVSTSGKEK